MPSRDRGACARPRRCGVADPDFLVSVREAAEFRSGQVDATSFFDSTPDSAPGLAVLSRGSYVPGTPARSEELPGKLTVAADLTAASRLMQFYADDFRS